MTADPASTDVNGFRLLRREAVPAARATALLFEHARSGAHVLHVHAPEDGENAFCVVIRTPPPDDTGLPHILEHSVLAGSRQYPVREPFFELVKSSMATFINAMTFNAFTAYPVCSPVAQDLFNLAEVYMDAVFHPLLTENTLRREGHHLAPADNGDPAAPLQIKGIVYSEMKGYYARPEMLMSWKADRALYPDTPLGRDSGGEPAAIPDLTYARFRQFHADHYHPSNALILLYGDIPTSRHLAFLGPRLDAFEHRATAVGTLPRQPRWPAPRRLDLPYPIGADDDLAGRGFASLNWVVGDAMDPAQYVAWEVLHAFLLGDDAAPLKRALIDSKLGADVAFSGAGGASHEKEFHVGLKGTEPDRAGAFEQLVLETLNRVADGTLDRGRVEAAFRQLAYDYREIKTLHPLHVCYELMQAWACGGDPCAFLVMGEHLDACRRRWEREPAFFNGLIRDGLVRNPHRLLMVLHPDPALQAREDAAVAARLEEQRRRFAPADIAAIAREAAALEAEQLTPNSPELVAKLPHLHVTDLPDKPRHIPTEAGREAGFDVLRNRVFANGVNHLELDIDLAGLPVELYADLVRYVEAFSKMGAAGQDFAAIAARRTADTGGLWCYPVFWRHATSPDRVLRRLRVGLKTLDSQAGDAFRLLGDLLFAADPHDRNRLRDVLTQTRAALRTALVNDALATARRQAGRGLAAPAALDSLLGGPDALRRVEALVGAFEAQADGVIQSIERIRDFVAGPARWTVSFTGSDAASVTLNAALAEWSARKQAVPAADALPPFRAYAAPGREGLAGPLNVAYCAQVMPGFLPGDPAWPVFRVGLHLVGMDYLLPEIRFKGNAYGAGATHDDGAGLLCFYSYSDPRIAATLDVFDGVRRFVEQAEWSRDDIDRAIIGCARDAEKPIRPAEATGQALTRLVRGVTPELRERQYAALLQATPASIRQTLLEQLDARLPHAALCVVASREHLEAANAARPQAPLAIAPLLP